ncbi:acetyltransferase [Indivirus ILV1]|uniref:Acetyltransferase n=1 Tax=Indivirus ILV1 TaxID=1977633 RepID=A0A1V0SE48_9VIRU|nr:acetyltransferase [Indivirus ILV1]
MSLSYRYYNYSIDTDTILDLHNIIFVNSDLLEPPIERLIKMEGIIIELNKKPIAYLLFSRNIKNNELWLYLEYLGVIPKYRNRGLGKLLINSFIKILDKAKINSYLDVEENSICTNKLIDFYTKYGYEITEYHRTSKYEDVTMTRMTRIIKKIEN